MMILTVSRKVVDVVDHLQVEVVCCSRGLSVGECGGGPESCGTTHSSPVLLCIPLFACQLTTWTVLLMDTHDDV